MGRDISAKVVTANDLVDGDVVYLGPQQTWVRDLSAAAVLSDEATAAAWLHVAEAQADRVVGAYLFDVHPGASGPEPRHNREAIRARGPSNYAHGKQVDHNHV